MKSDYIKSGSKLWRVVKHANGEYYYEIMCRGELLDTIRVNGSVVSIMKRIGVIKQIQIYLWR